MGEEEGGTSRSGEELVHSSSDSTTICRARHVWRNIRETLRQTFARTSSTGRSSSDTFSSPAGSLSLILLIYAHTSSLTLLLFISKMKLLGHLSGSVRMLLTHQTLIYTLISTDNYDLLQAPFQRILSRPKSNNMTTRVPLILVSYVHHSFKLPLRADRLLCIDRAVVLLVHPTHW